MVYMTAAELAEKLGISTKKLRGFLRKDGTFKNPGSGGKYSFDNSEAARVIKRWNANQSKKPSTPRHAAPINANGGPVPSGKRSADDSIPLRMALSRDPAVQAEVRKMVRERNARLEAQLRASGCHISQTGVAKKSRVA